MISIILAFVAGQLVMFYFTWVLYVRMRRSNALLANESDRYMILLRIARNDMHHHHQQEEFDNSIEVKNVNATFFANKKAIEEGNKY